MSNQNDTKKNDVIHIEVERMEFPAQAKCLYIGTKALCETLGSMFGTTFYNYMGCKIHFRNENSMNDYRVIRESFPQGTPYVDLFFEQVDGNTDPEMVNIIPISADTSKGSLLERMNRIVRSDARMYTLTDWTKKCLVEFLPNPAIPRWGERIMEVPVTENSMSGYNNRVTVMVTGLKLENMLANIYGGEVKDENGRVIKRYSYMINPIKKTLNGSYSPYMPQQAEDNAEYLVQVTQAESRIVDDISNTLGVGQQNPAQFNRWSGRR